MVCEYCDHHKKEGHEKYCRNCDDETGNSYLNYKPKKVNKKS